MSETPTRLVITRPSRDWTDRARRYRIKVDGATVGKLGHGDQLAVDVTPGPHRVQARIDWSGSPALDVDVVEGTDLHLIVEFASDMPIAVVWRMFLPNGWLRLRQASPQPGAPHPEPWA